MSETKLLASSLQHKWNDTGTDMRTNGEMRERRRGRQEVETEVKKDMDVVGDASHSHHGAVGSHPSSETRVHFYFRWKKRH